jgi:hypothetical protein
METPEKQKLCAYLQCRKDELIDLMRAYEKKQPVAFTDYGTLLWHGFCENPPEDIRRRMQPDA